MLTWIFHGNNKTDGAHENIMFNKLFGIPVDASNFSFISDFKISYDLCDYSICFPFLHWNTTRNKFIYSIHGLIEFSRLEIHKLSFIYYLRTKMK